MNQRHDGDQAISADMGGKHYRMLGLNLLLSFIIMYLAMFTMIWSTAEFFNNLNMVYMTLIMLAPMAILMLVMMRMMYPDRQLNMILYGVFAVVFALSFWAMRDQTIVGDRQFVRAMIPHHSGAMLMCERASIRDLEIRDLCFKPDGIVATQEREVDQMKAILKRLLFFETDPR